MEYHRLEAELRSKGFKQDMSENAPVCRWLVDAIKVDIMPTQEEILGFSNRWYLPAIKNADLIELENELTIKLVSPPYFLATKIDELVKSLKSPPPSRGRVRVGVISDCISGCNFPLPLIPSRKGRGKLT
ncbi:MAG: hypothetical protein ABIJ25_02460, partial [Pseudomonadota bacterium]